MKTSSMPKGPFARENIKTLPFRGHRGHATMTIMLSCSMVEGKYHLDISYIPGKLIIDIRSISNWLRAYKDKNMTLETLGQEVMNDFSNEIIPNWARLTLKSGDDFSITLEDKQPNYGSLKRISF